MDILVLILTLEDERDRSFVERLYIDHAKKMYELAYSILHDHSDAEDVVHDTVAIIVEKVDRFKKADREEYLKKLIVVTCRNVALKRYNQKAKMNGYLLSTSNDEDGETDIPDSHSDVEVLVVSEENCKRVYEALNTLELKYRDVLSLKIMGFDNRDISDVMNISPELVRKRISRARQMLLSAIGGVADVQK